MLSLVFIARRVRDWALGISLWLFYDENVLQLFVILQSKPTFSTYVARKANSDLFSAAKTQFHERYSIHSDAGYQGIYLVFWFGKNEKIAGKNNVSIESPLDLKNQIIEQMPLELRSFIDVFVLDLSR